MKTTFLHNVSNQMIPPASDISNCVEALYEAATRQDRPAVERLVDDIQQQGETITTTLDTLLSTKSM